MNIYLPVIIILLFNCSFFRNFRLENEQKWKAEKNIITNINFDVECNEKTEAANFFELRDWRSHKSLSVLYACNDLKAVVQNSINYTELIDLKSKQKGGIDFKFKITRLHKTKEIGYGYLSGFLHILTLQWFPYTFTDNVSVELTVNETNATIFSKSFNENTTYHRATLFYIGIPFGPYFNCPESTLQAIVREQTFLLLKSFYQFYTTDKNSNDVKEYVK
ncbi:MAG: hypothetical protein IPL26_10070 [Leptospiraceae bacterium]|nr:hypothetical protein [Leptospiraceae bacterium]